MRDSGDILQATFNSFLAKLDTCDGLDVPEDQFICIGIPPYGNELFAVHTIGPIYQGTPGLPRPGFQVTTGGVAMFAIDFAVTIVRAIPNLDNVGRILDNPDVTKATLKATADAKALVDTFYAAVADNSIVGSCDTLYLGGVTWVGPSGGMLGVQLNLSCQI